MNAEMSEAAKAVLRARMRAGLEEYWSEIVRILPAIASVVLDDIPRTPEENVENVKAFIVEEYLKTLVRYDPDVTPAGTRKEKLNKIAKISGSLILALRDPDPRLKAQFDLDSLRTFLVSFRDASVELIPKKVPRRPGPEKRHFDRAKKMKAAEFAVAIMSWCGMEPTLGRGGKFVNLTRILYAITAGEEGDVEGACSAHLKKIRAAS